MKVFYPSIHKKVGPEVNLGNLDFGGGDVARENDSPVKKHKQQKLFQIEKCLSFLNKCCFVVQVSVDDPFLHAFQQTMSILVFILLKHFCFVKKNILWFLHEDEYAEEFASVQTVNLL